MKEFSSRPNSSVWPVILPCNSVVPPQFCPTRYLTLVILRVGTRTIRRHAACNVESVKARAAFVLNHSTPEMEVKVLSLIEKQASYSSQARRKKKTKLQQVKLRPLSTEELCQVNLVTFRESFNHCRWPREVIEKLLTVQV